MSVYLRFSVEELRIIQRFGLQGIEYESAPMYSPEELDEIRERHAQEEAAIADAYKREFLRMAHEEAFDRYKTAKLSITLGDYIGDYPYVRVLPTTLGATTYADFLEKDVMPKIWQELEKRLPKDDQEAA